LPLNLTHDGRPVLFFNAHSPIIPRHPYTLNGQCLPAAMPRQQIRGKVAPDVHATRYRMDWCCAEGGVHS
jgi:hypothetical protein